MGLDMYLFRADYIRGATMDDVSAVEDWCGLLRENQSREKPYTLKEWCGREKEPSKKLINFYAPMERVEYSEWDAKHEHPWFRIKEEIGYWRKANMIHNWFVDHVQDGEDDCQYHREVTEEDLQELLDTCRTVLASTRLIPGMVENGRTYKDGKWETNWVNGKVLEDSSVAEELLPIQEGFFFGGTKYDEWYWADLVETVEILEKALATTDWEKQMVYYLSSW